MRPGIIMLCCILLSFTLFAQQAPIAIVSTNGATKLVNTLDEAALQAQTDDIIYLPAGNFSGQSIKHFDKRVTVIGVGHHPDSASAAGRTYITGNIGFQNPGAEGSTLDGVYITGLVYLSSNCTVVRTFAQNLFVSAGWTGENITIQECIATNFYANSASISNSRVKNSIITNVFTTNVNTTTFENCIFLFAGAYPLDQANQCIFRNCIFPNMTSFGGTSSSFYYNNIFAAAELPTLTSTANAARNILGQAAGTIFANQTGADFNYSDNYRLKSGSPGINAGTDGKDIGIYGGQKPYDDYAIPPNPSIRKREIDAETTPAGTLKVKFNVRVN